MLNTYMSDLHHNESYVIQWPRSMSSCKSIANSRYIEAKLLGFLIYKASTVLYTENYFEKSLTLTRGLKKTNDLVLFE